VRSIREFNLRMCDRETISLGNLVELYFILLCFYDEESGIECIR
jgi:hypothetical protein